MIRLTALVIASQLAQQLCLKLADLGRRDLALRVRDIGIDIQSEIAACRNVRDSSPEVVS